MVQVLRSILLGIVFLSLNSFITTSDQSKKPKDFPLFSMPGPKTSVAGGGASVGGGSGTNSMVGQRRNRTTSTAELANIDDVQVDESYVDPVLDEQDAKIAQLKKDIEKLQEDIRRIDREYDRFDERISRLEQNYYAVINSIKSLQQDPQTKEYKMDQVARQVITLDSRLQDIERHLAKGHSLVTQGQTHTVSTHTQDDSDSDSIPTIQTETAPPSPAQRGFSSSRRTSPVSFSLDPTQE